MIPTQGIWFFFTFWTASHTAFSRPIWRVRPLALVWRAALGRAGCITAAAPESVPGPGVRLNEIIQCAPPPKSFYAPAENERLLIKLHLPPGTKSGQRKRSERKWIADPSMPSTWQQSVSKKPNEKFSRKNCCGKFHTPFPRPFYFHLWCVYMPHLDVFFINLLLSCNFTSIGLGPSMSGGSKMGVRRGCSWGRIGSFPWVRPAVKSRRRVV